MRRVLKTYLWYTAKENTFLNKKRAVRAITLHLGDYRIDKLTPFLIERFRIDRMENDGVQASTINEDCSVLKHILNTAIREKAIAANPCKEIKKLKVETTRDRILSQKEISLILDMPYSKDRLMILFGLFTGMRLNEVLKLRWQDIDFSKGLGYLKSWTLMISHFTAYDIRLRPYPVISVKYLSVVCYCRFISYELL